MKLERYLGMAALFIVTSATALIPSASATSTTFIGAGNQAQLTAYTGNGATYYGTTPSAY
ncbi:hypothetical protein GC102_22920 [Paenibacillus sp. LMG 31460]|uniref:Uncharacterized protein n=1 Tax=Paenibacillus germinis TaxID=2654979 RepID=A0ABX1Z9K5_9BACL|nr:hypothetical protein [Paenibacillus germinis]NOU88583.1 hypothetical protein [Paenibacillus germinis]